MLPTENISKDEVWKLLQELLEEVLESDEISTFSAFYQRENLQSAWGNQLYECLNLPQPIDANLLYSKAAKQVLLLFIPVVNKDGPVKCNPVEARLMAIVTRVFVQEMIYRYWMFVGKVVTGIQVKLHRLVIARNPEIWEDFQKLLAIEELAGLEESVRSAGISEAPILPPASQKIDNGDGHPPCRLAWCAHLDGHKWVSDYLASKDVGWIGDSGEWHNLFHPKIHHVGQVVIIRKHQGKIALLIQLLIAAEKLEVAEGGKEYWEYLDGKFRSESAKPLRKGWSRQASNIRNNEGNFRKFLKKVTPILSHLGIENEDIKKFFGKMWERLGKDEGTIEEAEK